MLNKFIKYYQENNLFDKTNKILLTVSGGKDSIFMTHLFLAAKIDIGIAHCNFNLRGEEANLDELFVKELSKKNNIPFYVTHFKTKEYAKKKGVSIQMAARELRYNWFKEISTKNNYRYIATAHHKNDVAETMLMNLSKGTGLAGLHGISKKNEKIIRPILCFNRKEIDGFILKNKIEFREDLSNLDTKYIRNKIRHKIIPELETINPSIVETLFTESNQYLELEQILTQKIEEVKPTCCFYEEGNFKISIDKLLELSPLKSYLYYFIKEFGFNSSDVDDIILGLKNQSGKIYKTSSHQLLKDRKYLLITTNTNKSNLEYMINSLADFSSLPVNFEANIRKNSKEFQFQTPSHIAYLNMDLLKFPLTLRKWKNGDVFHPLGMKGKKKISDFFIDEKLSLKDKDEVWILSSNHKIIWVVGHRIDDNFKITNQTKLMLELIIL